MQDRPHVTLALALLALAPCVSYAAGKPLNVVLILIDDIGHHGVSAYGAKQVRYPGFFDEVPVATPRIDDIARQGLLCGHAYTYPLCENTRVALMSGQNNRRNFLNCKSQHASDITFGDLFKRAGYETCIVGKWKQTRGTKDIPAQEYISEFGWDEFFCFDVTNNVGRRMIEPYFVLNGETKDYRGIDPQTGRRWYGPELVNRYALDFIERKQDKPFFLYYSMLLLHAEHTPTPDTKPASTYDNFDVNKPGRGRLKGDDLRYYPDMVAYMDKAIGNVVDKLNALGIADETLVVVMGDNGSVRVEYVLPDGSVRHGGKGTHREGGLRVPLVMQAPDSIPAGSTYDGMVYVTDILPMLCDAAGVDIPNRESLDGITFWPQATGQATAPHRESICTWYIGNNHYTKREHILEYAFDKKFKRYAPDAMFPEGRFFEWWNDVHEEAGAPLKKKVPVKWKRYRYVGLDLDKLNPQQQAAYERLGKLLDQNRYTPVEGIEIVEHDTKVMLGETLTLHYQVHPTNATRTGVIWESSDPSIATVDKFGALHSHQEGKVKVTAYSWDDAEPSASGRGATYLTTGVKSTVEITIAAQ